MNQDLSRFYAPNSDFYSEIQELTQILLRISEEKIGGWGLCLPHIIIVSNSQYLPMNMVLSTKARDASSAARAKATDLAPNISLYFLSLLFLLSFVFSPPTLKFLDLLPQFLNCSQPTSPGPPLLPLFFITPFPKSLETFLSYQVIVFFLKLGIVMLVWLLILFPNIKQKMHIMGNSIKLNLT